MTAATPAMTKEPIDRPAMSAFEDQAFREAVRATGRRQLIIGGLHTEICLTVATVQALKDGYEVLYPADAVGGRSQVAHRTAVDRLAHADAVPKLTGQVGVAEAEKKTAAARGGQ